MFIVLKLINNDILYARLIGSRSKYNRTFGQH